MRHISALKLMIVGVGVFVLIQGDLTAQNIHYSTLSGYCEDAQPDNTDACEPCCQNHRHRYGQDDKFGEEQFQDTGWPNRREELSDELMH